ESEILRSIRSRAIAQIYEVGETDTGQPYMVLELADRGDLRRRVEEFRARGEVVEWADLWALGNHLHEALGSLHDRGIIHRDVSPGNILIQHREELFGLPSSCLLEPGERFILSDLGFAKDMEWASGFTAGGGTRGFASPEQLNEVTVVDHRTDIFSASAVIDWMVYDGPFARHFEPFLLGGLADDPNDRYASIDEWYDAFVVTMDALEEWDDVPRSGGWLAAAIVFAVGLAIIAGVLWYTDSLGELLDLL
ncbi:MAG: protein kinase, partial [Acidimicrobiia bacterium]|nr:protein kinase [Acidimicrobiia bacterium]